MDTLNLPDPDGSGQGGRAPSNEPLTLSPSAERHLLSLVRELTERVARCFDALAAREAEPQPLLTKQDVADRLLISPRTVETLMAEGKLTPIKVRGQIRFTPEAVDAYVRSAASRKTGRGR